jgi:hypothetical protein
MGKRQATAILLQSGSMILAIPFSALTTSFHHVMTEKGSAY